MQFTIPQFIDIEDKVIGPLTFKQFIYLVGGLGLGYVAYRLIPPLFGIPLALAFGALGASLAFLKVNGKPFIFTLQAFVFFIIQPKLYIWKKEKTQEPVQVAKPEAPQQKSVIQNIPRLTESKLGDLSWSLDILDMNQKNN